MDQLKLSEKLKGWIGKYKFPLLIILIGIGFMLLPGMHSEKTEDTVVATQQSETVEEQLREILCKIRGAGKVEVMLTEARGTQTVYQLDTNITERNDESSTRTDTVLISGDDRGQNGLVTQVIGPVYLGAIIVCQGGDDPTVKLAIIDAVSKITGLRSDKISVLKMK